MEDEEYKRREEPEGRQKAAGLIPVARKSSE